MDPVQTPLPSCSYYELHIMPTVQYRLTVDPTVLIILQNGCLQNHTHHSGSSPTHPETPREPVLQVASGTLLTQG